MRTAAGLALALATFAAVARAAPPCEYLLGYARGTAPHVEWRLFDALTGADTLLFVLPGTPSYIAWDSLPRVDITVGREIWRGEWTFESPRLVARMPDSISICDYGTGWCTTVDENDTIRVTTVWSSSDGFHWQASKPDTQMAEEPHDCEVYWRGLEGVVPSVFADQIPLSHESSFESGRMYAPVSDDTTRGFEYRWIEGGPDGPPSIDGPVFWVDHRAGRFVPLVPGDDVAADLAAACGVVALWSDDSGVCRLLDPATGRVLRTAPRGVIWVPRPRP